MSTCLLYNGTRRCPHCNWYGVPTFTGGRRVGPRRYDPKAGWVQRVVDSAESPNCPACGRDMRREELTSGDGGHDG